MITNEKRKFLAEYEQRKNSLYIEGSCCFEKSRLSVDVK